VSELIRCVCDQTCQTHNANGRIQFYDKGDVDSFKKCPKHFSALEGEEAKSINFETASQAELEELNYELSDLKSYIETRYDKKPGNRGADKLIKLLLDCRYRDLGDVNLETGLA
jgi:hypothetical protein